MIASVVLAAGLSRRMGTAKLVLPWGDRTVIEQVVQVVLEGGVDQVVVVTGAARKQVEEAIKNTPAKPVFNPDYKQDNMALSLQAGMNAIGENVEAVLVTLGDQPQIQAEVVRAVLDTYRQKGAPLVVPSYRFRRGHPWLLARSLWPLVQKLSPDETLREVLNDQSDHITYVMVETPSVLSDLDTPEAYQRQRPVDGK